MKKKAQGLSLNTIIIAALALLALVILALIFTNRMRDARERTQACLSNGGICVSNEIDTTTGGYRFCQGDYDRVITQDCDETQICCLTQ